MSLAVCTNVDEVSTYAGYRPLPERATQNAWMGEKGHWKSRVKWLLNLPVCRTCAQQRQY